MPATLIGATVVLDRLRFADIASGWWSLLTMLTVWVAIHHLGLVASEDVHATPRRATTVAVAGYLGLAALVVVALGVAHLGLAATVRPWAERVLDRSPALVDRCTRLNRAAMSVFAWHIPPWGVACVALRAVEFPIPAEPDGSWWITRPIWFVLPPVILIALPLLGRRR